MKKTTITITTLGLLGLVLCGLVIHLSCNKDDCPCSISNKQMALISYTQGQKVIFKNDATSILDTLYVSDKIFNLATCSYNCNNVYENIEADISFSHIGECELDLYHASMLIHFKGTQDGWYDYPFNGTTYSITVNGTTYNDAHLLQIDSTTIYNLDKPTVPWKCYYSKSKGFVRFYMVNGQIWSKQ